MLALCVFLITNQKLNAQTPAIKVGLFDIETMVRALPEYRHVDSLTAQYEQDSLASEQQEMYDEYQRLDSTYKADSAAKRPQSVLDYSKNLKLQLGYQLAYWQQIAQNKSDVYRNKIAQPLYAKVVAAYKKVLAAKKYTIVLKPGSFEWGFPIENVFPLVAHEMGVTIDSNLTVDPNTILDQVDGTDTTPQPKTGTGKP
jgi:Skp family chaperone for outer membrane proteins